MQETYALKKRIVIGMLAGIVLLATMFSFFFLVAEAHHDCVEEDCPICESMHLCKNIVTQINEIPSTNIPAIYPTFFVSQIVFIYTFIYLKETLVIKKVRFNN